MHKHKVLNIKQQHDTDYWTKFQYFLNIKGKVDNFGNSTNLAFRKSLMISKNSSCLLLLFYITLRVCIQQCHLLSFRRQKFKKNQYDLPLKRLRSIFRSNVPTFEQSVLSRTKWCPAENPTPKSSLEKVCEFKYALRKKKREKGNVSQIPVSGLFQKEFKKKKGNCTLPTQIVCEGCDRS